MKLADIVHCGPFQRDGVELNMRKLFGLGRLTVVEF